MNQWEIGACGEKSPESRKLEPSAGGRRVLSDCRLKVAVTREMVKSMAARPIIFDMANPIRKITAAEWREGRNDAIMATGRSDTPIRSTTCSAFPISPAARLTCARDRHQHGDEDGRREAALAALARRESSDEAPRRMGPAEIGPMTIPVPVRPAGWI